jgi:CBS domain-containing protein
MSAKGKARGPQMIPLSYTDESGPGALMWVAVGQIVAVRRKVLQGGTDVMLTTGITLESDDSLDDVLGMMHAAGAGFPTAEARND